MSYRNRMRRRPVSRESIDRFEILSPVTYPEIRSEIERKKERDRLFFERFVKVKDE